jgi:ABC-type cobalt transport system substrate-binding protein
MELWGKQMFNLLYENTYTAKTALTVTKNTVAQNGGIIDPNKTYSFQLKNSTGTNLSGSQTYTLSSTGTTDQTKSTTNGAFTLKAGETATFTGLSAATYQVAETSPGTGWTQQYATSSAGGSLGSYTTGATASSVVLTANNTTQVAFRNTYNPGKITVTKSVSGAPVGNNDTFEFTLTKAGTAVANAPYTVTGDTTVRYTNSNGHFYLQSGQTATIVNLGPDSSTNAYKVTETANSEYATTTTGGNANLTLAAGGTGTVSFTNIYAQSKTNVTFTKNVTGATAPTGAEFTFQVTVKKINGSPRTGSYSYIKSDGSSGTLTLNSSGIGIITGVTAGQTVTLHDLYVGDSYTINETSVTVNGVTTSMNATDDWTTTWTSGLKLVIPLNNATPDPVSGYTKWYKPVISYLVPGSGNPNTATISDVPAIPANSIVYLKRTSGSGAAPNPATDSSITMATLLTATNNSTGGISLTGGGLYYIAGNTAYTSVIARYYLYVDYGDSINTGRTANGVAYANSGVNFLNTKVPSVDWSFTKIAGSDTTSPLSGADFSLYKCNNTDAGHVHGTPGDDGSCWTLVTTAGSAVTTGLVSFPSLRSGTYALVETTSPQGYRMPAGYWILAVDATAQTVTISANGSPPAFIQSAGKNYLPNYEKTVLPISGGWGSLIFTASGEALIGGAVLMTFTGRKRKKNRHSHSDHFARVVNGKHLDP